MTIHRCFHGLFAVVAALLLAGCGEDPALVQKREEQAIEITKLQGEVKLIEEKLKRIPPDRTAELSASQEEARMLAAEMKELEAEVETLQARKRSIEAEFQRYRSKYAVK